MGQAVGLPGLDGHGAGCAARLWLGGSISPRHDRVLITTRVQMASACARSMAILVCVDGLAGYITAFLRVFRHPVRSGRRGRPQLVVEPALLLGQVVKQSTQRRVVRGTAEAIAAVLAAGLTDHRWTMLELLRYQVPLSAWVAPKRRRCPPRRSHQPVVAVAA